MSSFRTVRMSQSRFEKDHLRFLTVKSSHLNGRGDICIFDPPATERKDIPIVILLHGVYGSCWSWALNAGAHITAQKLIQAGKIESMILAMPSDGLWGDGSAYLPHSSADYERWITHDVITAVKENIPAATHSNHIFIAGLSMGGFGALRIGAKYPELFSAISGLSAITSLDQMSLFVEEPYDLYKQEYKSDESVYGTIHEQTQALPPLRFDCGVDDILIKHNRELHEKLEADHVKHDYYENSGSHEWAYWERHLEDTLLFFNQQL